MHPYQPLLTTLAEISRLGGIESAAFRSVPVSRGGLVLEVTWVTDDYSAKDYCRQKSFSQIR